MNKRKILYILLIAVLLTTPFGIFYAINQSKTINPIVNTAKDTKLYYVESGLEGVSQTIKDAVENYLNQNSSESSSTRKARLSLYFSANSPVYEYKTANITTSINRTTAKVTAIVSSAAEGVNSSYSVKADVTLYSGTKTETKNQTYWISVIKTSYGSEIPYDIGGA